MNKEYSMDGKSRILFILFVFTMLVVGNAVADEALMLDFSLLGADYPADDPVHNERTLLDYGFIVRSAAYTAEQRLNMRTSLAIPRWRVTLNSSARSRLSEALSYTREAYVSPDAISFPDQLVLGARVHFPNVPHNAWVEINPPFKIPSFADRDELQADGSLTVPPEEIAGGRKFDSFGVVQNTGVVRTITTSVYGLNYPHRISIVWRDQDDNQYEGFLGDLEYDGWRDLTWENPNYIEDVRNRNLRVLPLYPEELPHIRFEGFRIYRDGGDIGGDFVTYFKAVQVTFDRAYVEADRAIDDEAVWGIIRTRRDVKSRAMLERVGKRGVLEYIESLKKHIVEDDEDSF